MRAIQVFLFAILVFAIVSPVQAYRDKETGTFITRDPAGFVDGPNLYTYVKQNPWTKIDPTGLALTSLYNDDEVDIDKELRAEFDSEVQRASTELEKEKFDPKGNKGGFGNALEDRIAKNTAGRGNYYHNVTLAEEIVDGKRQYRVTDIGGSARSVKNQTQIDFIVMKEGATLQSGDILDTKSVRGAFEVKANEGQLARMWGAVTGKGSQGWRQGKVFGTQIAVATPDRTYDFSRQRFSYTKTGAIAVGAVGVLGGAVEAREKVHNWFNVQKFDNQLTNVQRSANQLHRTGSYVDEQAFWSSATGYMENFIPSSMSNTIRAGTAYSVMHKHYGRGE